MIGWKEIGRSHMEKNKTNRWCDYGQETQFKVLEPVNTITQRHESHKKRNSKGISIKTLKARRASSAWTKMKYYWVKDKILEGLRD